MAREEKHLPHKHEDLNLNSGHTEREISYIHIDLIHIYISHTHTPHTHT